MKFKKKIYNVPKIFGDGKIQIEFYYRTQIQNYNCGFTAKVDSVKWEDDQSAMMDEVQEYLLEELEQVDNKDYAEQSNCKKCKSDKNNYYCEKHEEDFYKYLYDRFPFVDLEYGGVSYYGEVKNN